MHFISLPTVLFLRSFVISNGIGNTLFSHFNYSWNSPFLLSFTHPFNVFIENLLYAKYWGCNGKEIKYGSCYQGAELLGEIILLRVVC
jgi:hypothetical protein